MNSIKSLNNWHSFGIADISKRLKVNIKKGLSDTEVKKRRKEYGRNLLPGEKPLSKLQIILSQFKSPLIYILVVAGIVVLFFREYTDAIVIFSAVFVNTVVGYIQENKASQALRELKKVVKVKVQALRNGNIKLIDSSVLVPGDIICLSSGDKVPADARIIENFDLKVNEMSLTGEWLPAQKKTGVLKEKTGLADRDNMAYMGTVVEYGKGKAIVVSTGVDTEIGQVAQMVRKEKEAKTPLQKRLIRFSKIVGVIILIISLIIFLEGIISGNSFIEMFTVAVAVAVAAIPEGLPIAMTVILALGMQRILKRKGLVRKLLAAETLGSTSIIATDKTRTLTEGKMVVSDILAGNMLLDPKNITQDNDKMFSLKIATLVNEAFIENPEDTMKKWIIQGKPTDKALLRAGMEAGLNKRKLESKMKLIAELGFDSRNKYLAKAFSLGNNKDILYVAGAPEKLLDMSVSLKIGDKEKKIGIKEKKEIKARINELTGKGLRVVAVGYKDIKDVDKLFNNLVFTGLISLKDPIRKEAKRAMKVCRSAGMTPIIVTGDHKLTAKAVALELGFKINDRNIMEGKDLDELSDAQFKKKIKTIKVYARVEPKHKMRIVQMWQDLGEVVAMTGDGINDAPALKKADIGVSLGSGTGVAKEVSDLVLLTDNFNIIVAAIEEGRAIIDNIRKVIIYLLSDSFTETILIGVSLLLGLPLPISAVQILWVNLIEDGFPGIALAFEPKEKDLMKRKPHGRNSSLLNKEMKVIIFLIGIITDLLLLGLFFWLWKQNYDIKYIRTMIFAGLTVDSLFYVFSCKSLRQNIWRTNIFSNKLLVYAWIFGLVMLVASIYIPVLQLLLKTVPLGLIDWTIVLSLGLIEMILIELTKYIFIIRHKT